MLKLESKSIPKKERENNISGAPNKRKVKGKTKKSLTELKFRELLIVQDSYKAESRSISKNKEKECVSSVPILKKTKNENKTKNHLQFRYPCGHPGKPKYRVRVYP